VVARVTVTLPDDVLERLDAVAADEDTSRSEVVREAAVSAETRARAAAVTDGLAWLEDVARKPSADPRSTVDILRETRELDGGLVESAPPDVRPSRR
jgi:predicted transcriptional regulator